MGVTFLIERYGGVFGGILGTTPTIIIVTCIGFVIELYDNDESFAAAIFTVPTGIVITALFLYIWRILPPLLPSHWTTNKKLIVMVFSSFLVWFILALSFVFGVSAIVEAYQIPNLSTWIGLASLACHLIFGPILVFLAPAQAPPGKHKVKPLIIFARAILGFLALFVAVILTTINEIAAGIVATFPYVHATIMVSLWISQDSSVSVGAVGPIMVGCTSVPMYACLFYGFVFLFKPIIGNIIWTIVIAVLLSYVGAVLSCTIPAYWIIRSIRADDKKDVFKEDETTVILSTTKK